MQLRCGECDTWREVRVTNEEAKAFDLVLDRQCGEIAARLARIDRERMRGRARRARRRARARPDRRRRLRPLTMADARDRDRRACASSAGSGVVLDGLRVDGAGRRR